LSERISVPDLKGVRHELHCEFHIKGHEVDSGDKVDFESLVALEAVCNISPESLSFQPLRKVSSWVVSMRKITRNIVNRERTVRPISGKKATELL
jgi:hypothetical protein